MIHRPALGGFLIVILALFAGPKVFAQTPQQLFMESFHSPQIQFPAEGSEYAKVSPGRYPLVLKFLFQKVLSWNPDGAPAGYSPPCEPDLWRERLLSPGVKSPQLQSALVRRYLTECKSELETGRGELMNLLKVMTLEFSPQEHPFLRRVVFPLPGGIKLKGYLALKGDFKKRPFVVLRLGIFSSVEDFLPERYLVMQLFEQSPFNLLIVENMSGPDFVADNERFSFGGYDEGLQNMWLARLLRDPQQPLSRLVESLHFVGMSLGGHGVLFASLLNEQMKDPPVQSFLALCPVIHLRETFQSLQRGWLRSAAANYWSSQRLEGLRRKVPALKEVSRFRILPEMIRKLTENYHGGLSWTPQVLLPPGMSDGPDFWKQNDFWSYYHDVKTPVSVWSTKDDPLVPFAANAADLREPNIGVVPFSQGVHCTLPIAYRWDAITSLLQAQILSHSAYRVRPESMRIEIGADSGWGERQGRIPYDVDWVPGKKIVSLRMKDLHFNLPVSVFDFNFLNPDLSQPEKRMLERWLHQNLSARLIHEHDRRYLEVTWLR